MNNTNEAQPTWMAEANQIKALQPKHILFLCVANSARSQMAEGLARQMAPKTIAISSAGSSPSSVRPEALEVLREIGIDISKHHSKSTDDIDGSDVDVVITLCADEVCPVWLHKARRFHWGLPDPAASTGDQQARLNAFREVRDELRKRLTFLFD